jgi:hypothetical protein
METENRDDLKFLINVNGKTYNVTADGDKNLNSYFKIETDCEYLFTVSMDEEGQWYAEKDVTVLDENLVEQIGRAIEEHDGR